MAFDKSQNDGGNSTFYKGDFGIFSPHYLCACVLVEVHKWKNWKIEKKTKTSIQGETSILRVSKLKIIKKGQERNGINQSVCSNGIEC